MKIPFRRIVLPMVPLAIVCGLAFAGSSYKGYSGASGTLRCASSCHGSTGGTLTVSGIPAVYTPGQSYTIVIGHTGSTKIRNYNASSRVGSTTTIAGVFTAVTNAVSYSVSAESGMRSSPNEVDSSVFSWTAPSSGTGAVTFYIAGYQGTTKSGGISTAFTATSTEITTDVLSEHGPVRQFSLSQNYPNPFNPSTTIEFSIGSHGTVSLRVFDLGGRELATLVNETRKPGSYSVQWNAARFPSGVYLYRLQANGRDETKRLLLVK
jgi:hypothetical protein